MGKVEPCLRTPGKDRVHLNELLIPGYNFLIRQNEFIHQGRMVGGNKKTCLGHHPEFRINRVTFSSTVGL